MQVEDKTIEFARGKIAGYREHAELVIELVKQGHTAEEIGANIADALQHLEDEPRS